MPRHRSKSRSKSPLSRIRKKGNLTIIEGMYQPSRDEDKKIYDQYQKWISEVAQTAAPPLKHLTPDETLILNRAKKYAMECSVQAVLTKKPMDAYSNLTEDQRRQQRDRAIALMCRVYVGSINYDLNEEDLRKAFCPFGPIKVDGINLSWDNATLTKARSHKGYAFLEYQVPESAQLALDQMNGVMLGGKALKCARPSNIPAALPLIKQITEEAADQPRIFVASIHQDLTEEEIKAVFGAFGEIRHIYLAPDTMPGKHLGYGFIEYDTLDAASDAVSAMNLFDLGGQFLRVGRAITPPTEQQQRKRVEVPPEVVAAAAAINAVASRTPGDSSGKSRDDRSSSRKKHRRSRSRHRSRSRSRERSSRRRSTERGKKSKDKKKEKEEKKESESEDELNAKEKAKKTIETLKGDLSISQEEEMSITGSNARFMIMQKLAMKDKESSVMVLKNMVTFDQVDDELEGEVREECSKYGKVKKVVVYQEAQGEDDDAEIIVKIFVQFDKTSECEVAVKALHGRWFGGKMIDAGHYEELKFVQDDLSG